MTFFCARFVPFLVLVSSEVITILNEENITCLLTKESVYSALYIWPPIYHQNGSMVNIKRSLVEIDNWGRDDWDVVNKVDYKSHFAPITDIRWEAYDIATATSFTVEPLFSVSACSTNRVDNSFLLNQDLFVATSLRKTTDGKEFCSWIHYSVSTDTIVKNIQDTTSTERRQSANNSNFDIHVLLSNNIVKFHKNQFRFSETETTHPGKRSYINLINVTNSATLCIAMFVAIDKLCQLDVTIESGEKVTNQTIFGFNDVFSSAIKYWKRVEIKFSYYSGSGRLLFLRRKPYSSYYCFWAIDSIHLCKPGIDIHQITRPRDSRHDYVCRTLDNRNQNKSAFCNNTKYLDTGCRLQCEDVMGDNYPYCDSHQICLENGDCKCPPGNTNSTCLFSYKLEPIHETDGHGKSCIACYSSNELILYIFVVLLIQFFIGCVYYIHKNGCQIFSSITNFCRRSVLGADEIELQQREQLLSTTEKKITKVCILEDFPRYNLSGLILREDSSKTRNQNENHSGTVANHAKNSNLEEDFGPEYSFILEKDSKSHTHNIYKFQLTGNSGNHVNGTYVFNEGSEYDDDFINLIIQEEIETVLVILNETSSIFKGSLVIQKLKPTSYVYYEMVPYMIHCNAIHREMCIYYANWNPDDAKCLNFSKILPLLRRLFELSKTSTAPIMIKGSDNNLSGTLLICNLALQIAETGDILNMCKLLKCVGEQRPNIITDQKYYILANLTVLYRLLEEPCLVKEQPITLNNDEKLTSSIKKDPPSINVFARGVNRSNQFLIDKLSNNKSIKEFWSRVAEEDIECILFVDQPADELQLWPCSRSDDISRIEVTTLSAAVEYQDYYKLDKVLLKVAYKKDNCMCMYVSSSKTVGLFKLHNHEPKSLLETLRAIQRIFPGKRILLSYGKSLRSMLLVVTLLCFDESEYLM